MALIDASDYFVQLGQIKTTGTDQYGSTAVTSTNTVSIYVYRAQKGENTRDGIQYSEASHIGIVPASVTVKADDELWTVVNSQGVVLFDKARILSVQSHAPWWDTVLFKELELDVSRGPV